MEILTDELYKVWEELGKQIANEESVLMALKQRRQRLSKAYVWVSDKKAKTSTEIIRNETDESFLNRLKGKTNEPLKFGVLCVADDYGGHPLTVEEFKSWLNDKDIKLDYYFNLTAEDIIKMIDIKEVTEVTEEQCS